MERIRAIFLDTATQIARHWHAESEQTEIKEQFKHRKLYCSRYVKCQYKATLLNSLIGLHNLLLRFKDLIKALQESKNYSNKDVAGLTLTKSVQERINEIGLWLARRYSTYEEQKRRLEVLIEDAWETLFHDRLEAPLIDETSCLYADGAPMLGESQAYKPIDVSCTKARPPDCGIQEFWANHSIGLHELANMQVGSIAAEPKDTHELRRIKEHAARTVNGEPPHGQRCTAHLSDAIICLESSHCPEIAAVHSTNKKHFRPLGEVLGVECEPKDESDVDGEA